MKLSCYFFSNFMVKQYDKGDLGSEWLAIVPIRNGAVPACTRSHGAREKVIHDQEWLGYFEGVKDNLVFFHAEDMFNGGSPFAVYNANTRSKVFDDSAAGSLTFDRAPDGHRTLKYVRAVVLDCSILKDKTACWDKFRAGCLEPAGLERPRDCYDRKDPELASAPIPECSGYAVGGADSDDPSVIGYPVEVTFSPRPSIRRLPGPIKCWPAD
jgi:hypothetical protein